MASCSQKSAAEANLLGKRKPKDGLETKSILKRHKEKSEEKEQIEGSVELSERKSDEANLTSVEETPDFVEEAAAETVEGLPEFAKEPKKSVVVANLPPETEISDIIDFFKDVGQVVRLQFQTNYKRAWVEFASANQAKKALEKKEGQHLHNRRILFPAVANKGTRCHPPKYCIDHKVWYEQDYFEQQESLPIAKDPNSVKEAAVLFVANLSAQTTQILHIIHFFKDVGDVVSVRLIVNHEGKHVGCGFVEFATAHQANWALENKNGEYLHDHKIFLMQGLDETPDFAEAAAMRNKTLFVANLSIITKISDIINFFKDVGEVVHVRLIVNPKCRLAGFGYVEFASANEAEKALKKKKGEYLHNREIDLCFAKTDADPSDTKYCIDHKVWYEERESLVIEDAADESPDFVEDVALRKKTVFLADLSMKNGALCSIQHIRNFFKDVGEVVRVRLCVDHWGEHAGCCFVEFASANEANKAVQEKQSKGYYNLLLNVAEMDRPYPFRPKYKLAEKLWYEDNLRREGFGLTIKSKLREAEPTIFCGKKIALSDKV